VPQQLLALPAKEVVISRTDPNAAPSGPKPTVEIRKLYVDAIMAAERLIYLETQYFSSCAIADAFEARMRAPGRPTLEIVMILNKRGETLKEQVAVGLAQAQNLGRIRALARETGHKLGLYITLPACSDEKQPEHGTFIHSKLMIVDDRFLTVGSANLTNRSMAVDTELNASVEAESDDDELGLAIRQVRAALLAEHTGGPEIAKVRGLVEKLDQIAERGAAGARTEPCRLRKHPSPTEQESAALRLFDPQALPFDPDESDLPR
jgi:phospholipase D1/2